MIVQKIKKDRVAHLEQKIIDALVLLEELQCKLPMRYPRSVWTILGDLRRALGEHEDMNVSTPRRVDEGESDGL